ncbi:MAG: Lrp/AsnC family transcriptional regulator [Methanobacteriota archaeon]|nr:MAG: Lrp/AsnC family transcriptional regulator [Euryarchaeota archaeon]
MDRQDTVSLDKNDEIILKMLQEDCKISLKDIGLKTGLSSSTVHYRVNRLLEEGVITGFKACVDPVKVGKNMLAIALITGRYGPDYSKKIGEKLSEIPGVWAVYFLLGNIDFAVLLRASSREELKSIVDAFIRIDEVERSNTYLILDRRKEDLTVQL